MFGLINCSIEIFIWSHISFSHFPFTVKPSRVIHIRNIPNEASDAEVINLGVQFGRVTNVLVLKGKNQAFLEMADEGTATTMVTYFTTNPPTVRGRTVYVQFSNHRELKTDQNHSILVSIFHFYTNPVKNQQVIFWKRPPYACCSCF